MCQAHFKRKEAEKIPNNRTPFIFSEITALFALPQILFPKCAPVHLHNMRRNLIRTQRPRTQRKSELRAKL